MCIRDRLGGELAGEHFKEGKLAEERVGNGFEHIGAQRAVGVTGKRLHRLICARHELGDPFEQYGDTLERNGGTAEHRCV